MIAVAAYFRKITNLKTKILKEEKPSSAQSMPAGRQVFGEARKKVALTAKGNLSL